MVVIGRGLLVAAVLCVVVMLCVYCMLDIVGCVIVIVVFTVVYSVLTLCVLFRYRVDVSGMPYVLRGTRSNYPDQTKHARRTLCTQWDKKIYRLLPRLYRIYTQIITPITTPIIRISTDQWDKKMY